MTNLNSIIEKAWDVVVVGTGIGGGTIGRRLAEKGLSVLFVEQGPNSPRGEQTMLNGEMFDPFARQVRGFWPKRMRARVNGRSSEFFGPIGAGVGGSSVFYAATLERPERHDLDNSLKIAHPTGGWPVSFDEFQPYFDQAEQIYQVHGDEDPLSDEAPSSLMTPPAATAGDQAMIDGFRAQGLHPYHAHIAARYITDCNRCFGHKCPKNCKMDGRSAGVEPAIATGRATVLANCEVTKINATEQSVNSIDVLYQGELMQLVTDKVVLAAGALGSPRLLLASKNDFWPNGLGNTSDTVGRNLMFHLNEMVAIWPMNRMQFEGASKAIAMRDFYHQGGQRFGVFQAMGLDAKYGDIVQFLNNLFDRSILKSFKSLRSLTRIPAIIAARIFGTAKVFVGILEDLPYRENRVVLDENDVTKISIEYTFVEELLSRRKKFRKLIKSALKKQRILFLGLQPELNFGHPSGTVRFGDNSKNSVLDRNCKVHGLDNLFVVDASFMPTSMGVNPSLTIAANALRVGDFIAGKAHSAKGGIDEPLR